METQIKEELDIVTLDNFDSVIVFDPKNNAQLIQAVKEEALSLVCDIDTKEGRAAQKSQAYKVSKLKSHVVGIFEKQIEDKKKEVSIATKSIRELKEGLDAVRDEVKRPAIEWEEKEDKRIEAHITASNNIKMIGDECSDLDEGELSVCIEQVKAFDPSTLEEFSDKGELAKSSSIIKLENELLKKQIARKEKAELDALRKEKAEKEAKAEAERVEREAKEKADAEEKQRLIDEKQEADRKLKAAEEAAKQAAIDAEIKAKQKIEADKKAAEDIERAKQQAIEEERNRVAALEAKAKSDAEEKQRIEDRTKINHPPERPDQVEVNVVKFCFIKYADKVPVDGQVCLTKMKHGMIEGIYNASEGNFSSYYWSDIEWNAYEWAAIESGK